MNDDFEGTSTDDLEGVDTPSPLKQEENVEVALSTFDSLVK
jgi:hypothetical protein